MVDPDKSDLPVEPLLRAEPLPLFRSRATQRSSLFRLSPRSTKRPLAAPLGIADEAFGQSLSDLRDALGALNLKTRRRAGRRCADACAASPPASPSQSGPPGPAPHPQPAPDILLQHSLSVAFIAMLMARELGMSPSQDRGGRAGWPVARYRRAQDPEPGSARKRGELNKAELNFLNMHPQYGLEMLNQAVAGLRAQGSARLPTSITSGWTAAVFPFGIQGDRIPPSPASSAWWSCSDELLHPRSGLHPAGPSQAIGQLYKLSQKKFNQESGQIVDKGMGVYPPIPG